MDVIIRNARPDDAAGIVEMWNPIIEEGKYTVFDQPFTVEAEKAYIESLNERDIFIVAERVLDGHIVGFQSMSPFPNVGMAMAHVGTCGTFVDQGTRRQGIASKLFAQLFAEAKQKGYEKIFTYVRADNETALAVYQSQGFRIVGRAERQAKIQGQYVDEIIIEKMLVPELTGRNVEG